MRRRPPRETDLPRGWPPAGPLLLFFFLRGERLLYRPCAADPFIDFDEGSLQLAIVPKGLDLALGLALCRRRCEALGDCLAIHLVGQPQMRAVAWIIGAVAMATGVAATATGAGNRTRAKITPLRNLSQDCVSLILQIGERLGHKRPPLPSVSYTLGNAAQIRKPAFRPLSRRGPAGWRRRRRKITAGYNKRSAAWLSAFYGKSYSTFHRVCCFRWFEAVGRSSGGDQAPAAAGSAAG